LRETVGGNAFCQLFLISRGLEAILGSRASVGETERNYGPNSPALWNPAP